MKTIRRSTCALSGAPVRLVEHDGAYALVIGAESHSFGFDAARAEQAFHAVAAPRVPRDVRAALKLPLRAATVALCAAFALMATTATAEAPKAQKPTVCASGTAVKGDGFEGFVCTDGKRPKLLARWTSVRFVSKDGSPARYVLGWM